VNGGDRRVLPAPGSRRATSAVRFAQALGLDVLRDRGGGAGLNAALLDGLRLIGPRADALLVAADLPGLGAQDVGRVLAADTDVVVAPTRDRGTGGLLLRAGVRIDLAYGQASADAHRRTALRAGLRVTTVTTPGFHHDVDEPADLHEAVARWPGSRTGRTVRGWDAEPARPVPHDGIPQPLAVHPAVPAILNTSTRANG
jgi:2-phospho-L-lactate guanylyltransferase